jgi:ATP-dependent Clp protease ATP-binding subunit ClpA
LADRLACERLYDVDMQAVLAASPTGDALRRAVRAIGLAARNRGNVLLCIAGIDRCLRRGAETGDFDTEKALRIGIARGYLQVPGTMANPAAAQEILSSPVINRRTQLVQVPVGGTSPRTVEHTSEPFSF